MASSSSVCNTFCHLTILSRSATSQFTQYKQKQMNIKVLCAHPTCTYFLGKSLYIPLTSRSNCYTLPETRGPGFTLPRAVVASLLRVREYEARNDNTPDDIPEAYDRKPKRK
jgi:hypothetical protein